MHPIKDVGVTITNGGKDFYISGDLSKSDFKTNFGGLTKREYFAMHAMKCISDTKGAIPNNQIAEEAVSLADALIEALNKEEE